MENAEIEHEEEKLHAW